jgi:hypothetical protein
MKSRTLGLCLSVCFLVVGRASALPYQDDEVVEAGQADRVRCDCQTTWTVTQSPCTKRWFGVGYQCNYTGASHASASRFGACHSAIGQLEADNLCASACSQGGSFTVDKTFIDDEIRTLYSDWTPIKPFDGPGPYAESGQVYPGPVQACETLRTSNLLPPPHSCGGALNNEVSFFLLLDCSGGTPSSIAQVSNYSNAEAAAALASANASTEDHYYDYYLAPVFEHNYFATPIS